MANEVTEEFTKYIKHLANEFSKKTGVKLSEKYLTTQVENFNRYYNREEVLHKKQPQMLPGVYHQAINDLATQLFKDIMYTPDEVTVNKEKVTPDVGSNAQIITGDKTKFKNFMSDFDELITSISIAYIKSNKRNKTILTTDSHKVFGGMEARDFAKILKPVNNEGITNAEKLEVDSNGSMDILMDNLERHVRGVTSYHRLENEVKEFDDQDIELNNKQELYQNAFNLAKNTNAHNFDEEFSSHKEALAEDIEKMATAYTLLRDKYHSKSFGHKWFTKEGWAQSKAINAARKKMKEVLGVKTDKEFNTIMKQISEKDSKFTSNIGKEINELKGLYDTHKKDYQQNITNKLIEVGFGKKNIVVPDEKVNENVKVDEALIDISGNQKEQVKDIDVPNKTH